MADPASLAASAAVAGTVAKIGSGIFEGIGAYQGLAEKANQAAAAGRAARTAALETDAYLQRELATTLENITAIRASAGVGINSPTTDAILQKEAKESDRQRRIRVNNLINQSTSDFNAADYYSGAAPIAFASGVLGSAGNALSLFSKTGS